MTDDMTKEMADALIEGMEPIHTDEADAQGTAKLDGLSHPPGGGTPPAEELGYGLYMFLPTPGWMVRQPDVQDPQKRNGDTLQSPWMPAIGISAESLGADGLRMYSVLVVTPNGQQAVIEHVGLEWTPLRFNQPTVPDNMVPMRQGA